MHYYAVLKFNLQIDPVNNLHIDSCNPTTACAMYKCTVQWWLLFWAGGAAAQRASKGAQEGAKRAAANSVSGVSVQVGAFNNYL